MSAAAVNLAIDRCARVIDCTPEQYLADPCAVPSLSASIAHEIVYRSPAHGWAKHPKLGGGMQTSDTSDAKDDGSILHKLILGRGKELAVLDHEAYRSNAAKRDRDGAIAAGLLPVKRAKYEELTAVAEILRDKCLRLGIVFDGRSEVPIEFVEELAGDRRVLCRAMLDHVWLDRGTIIDVKKVRSASPRDIARHFIEYGYHIQWAAYTRCLAALEPEFAGRIDFQFLFMEIEPPYSVVPARPDGAFREIGTMHWLEAVHRWRECIDSGTWPGYCESSVILEAPVYEINRYIGNMEAAA